MILLRAEVRLEKRRWGGEQSTSEVLSVAEVGLQPRRRTGDGARRNQAARPRRLPSRSAAPAGGPSPRRAGARRAAGHLEREMVTPPRRPSWGGGVPVPLAGGATAAPPAARAGGTPAAGAAAFGPLTPARRTRCRHGLVAAGPLGGSCSCLKSGSSGSVTPLRHLVQVVGLQEVRHAHHRRPQRLPRMPR